MDELTLIQLAKQGSTDALAELYRNSYSLLRNYLIKVTLRPHLAEDLSQETMIKAMEKLHLYHPDKSRFSSWLITIASRLYIDYLRKEKRERQMQEEEQSLRQLRWQAQSTGEQWHELLDALASIPPDIRLPIIMKHYYGYSQEQISSMLDIPAGTVKSRIFNGLKRLRKEMDIDENVR